MNDTNSDLTSKTESPENAELISFDSRLQNVEKIANTIDNVAGKALESWSHYLEQKNEQVKTRVREQLNLILETIAL